MQDQIRSLQQQTVNANQMIAQATSAYQNLTNSRSTGVVAKPDSFYGKNVHSWFQSAENYSSAQRIELDE